MVRDVLGKLDKYAGGNSVCPRPTPEWQKGISKFLLTSPKSDSADGASEKEKENEQPKSPAAAAEDVEMCEGGSGYVDSLTLTKSQFSYMILLSKLYTVITVISRLIAAARKLKF